MSKNWKRGLALLMAAMMLAPSSNLTAWQSALGTAIVAEAARAASTPQGTTVTVSQARATMANGVDKTYAIAKTGAAAPDTAASNFYVFTKALDAGWYTADRSAVTPATVTPAVDFTVQTANDETYKYLTATVYTAGWYRDGAELSGVLTGGSIPDIASEGFVRGGITYVPGTSGFYNEEVYNAPGASAGSAKEGDVLTYKKDASTTLIYTYSEAENKFKNDAYENPLFTEVIDGNSKIDNITTVDGVVYKYNATESKWITGDVISTYTATAGDKHITDSSTSETYHAAYADGWYNSKAEPATGFNPASDGNKMKDASGTLLGTYYASGNDFLKAGYYNEDGTIMNASDIQAGYWITSSFVAHSSSAIFGGDEDFANAIKVEAEETTEKIGVDHDALASSTGIIHDINDLAATKVVNIKAPGTTKGLDYTKYGKDVTSGHADKWTYETTNGKQAALTDEEFKALLVPGAIVTIDNSTTRKLKYLAQYNDNKDQAGGSSAAFTTGIIGDNTDYVGKSLVKPSTEPTEAGYTFMGWAPIGLSETTVATDLETKDVVDISTYVPTEDVTFYAVWEKDVFSFPTALEVPNGQKIDRTALNAGAVAGSATVNSLNPDKVFVLSDDDLVITADELTITGKYPKDGAVKYSYELVDRTGLLNKADLEAKGAGASAAEAEDLALIKKAKLSDGDSADKVKFTTTVAGTYYLKVKADYKYSANYTSLTDNSTEYFKIDVVDVDADTISVDFVNYADDVRADKYTVNVTGAALTQGSSANAAIGHYEVAQGTSELAFTVTDVISNTDVTPKAVYYSVNGGEKVELKGDTALWSAGKSFKLPATLLASAGSNVSIFVETETKYTKKITFTADGTPIEPSVSDLKYSSIDYEIISGTTGESGSMDTSIYAKEKNVYFPGKQDGSVFIQFTATANDPTRKVTIPSVTINGQTYTVNDNLRPVFKYDEATGIYSVRMTNSPVANLCAIDSVAVGGITENTVKRLVRIETDGHADVVYTDGSLGMPANSAFTNGYYVVDKPIPFTVIPHDGYVVKNFEYDPIGNAGDYKSYVKTVIDGDNDILLATSLIPNNDFTLGAEQKTVNGYPAHDVVITVETEPISAGVTIPVDPTKYTISAVDDNATNGYVFGKDYSVRLTPTDPSKPLIVKASMAGAPNAATLPVTCDGDVYTILAKDMAAAVAGFSVKTPGTITFTVTNYDADATIASDLTFVVYDANGQIVPGNAIKQGINKYEKYYLYIRGANGTVDNSLFQAPLVTNYGSIVTFTSTTTETLLANKARGFEFKVDTRSILAQADLAPVEAAVCYNGNRYSFTVTPEANIFTPDVKVTSTDGRTVSLAISGDGKEIATGAYYLIEATNTSANPAKGYEKYVYELVAAGSKTVDGKDVADLTNATIRLANVNPVDGVAQGYSISVRMVQDAGITSPARGTAVYTGTPAFKSEPVNVYAATQNANFEVATKLALVQKAKRAYAVNYKAVDTDEGLVVAEANWTNNNGVDDLVIQKVVFNGNEIINPITGEKCAYNNVDITNNIPGWLRCSADNQRLVIDNAAGETKLGTYTVTLSNSKPGINGNAVGTVKFILAAGTTAAPTATNKIVRPQGKAVSISLAAGFSNKGIVKKVKYSIENITPPVGVAYAGNYININEKTGKLSIDKKAPSLANYTFDLVSEAYLEDGSQILKSTKQIAITEVSAVTLDMMAIVKDSIAAPTAIKSTEILNYNGKTISIPYDEIGKYMVLPVQLQADGTYTALATPTDVVCLPSSANIIDMSNVGGYAGINLDGSFKLGTVKFTASTTDGTKKAKTAAIRITKSSNLPVTTVTTFGTIVTSNKTIINNNDALAAIDMTIQAAAGSTAYVESSVAVKGGKVVSNLNRIDGMTNGRTLSIIPTAATTIVTVKNPLDKTQTYTITFDNTKYRDLKNQTIKLSPSNKKAAFDNDGALTGQSIEYVLSGSALANATYIQIDADSMIATLDGKIVASKKQVEIDRLGDQKGSYNALVAGIQAGNPDKTAGKVLKVTTNAAGKKVINIPFAVVANSTIANGTYTLDAYAYGSAYASSVTKSNLVAKPATFTVKVNNSPIGYAVPTTVSVELYNASGDVNTISGFVGNGYTFDISLVAGKSASGKVNKFDTAFGLVKENETTKTGIVTGQTFKLKVNNSVGITADDLNGMLKYEVKTKSGQKLKDKNGNNVAGLIPVTVTLKEASIAKKDELLAASIKDVLTQASLDRTEFTNPLLASRTPLEKAICKIQDNYYTESEGDIDSDIKDVITAVCTAAGYDTVDIVNLNDSDVEVPPTTPSKLTAATLTSRASVKIHKVVKIKRYNVDDNWTELIKIDTTLNVGKNVNFVNPSDPTVATTVNNLEDALKEVLTNAGFVSSLTNDKATDKAAIEALIKATVVDTEDYALSKLTVVSTDDALTWGDADTPAVGNAYTIHVEYAVKNQATDLMEINALDFNSGVVGQQDLTLTVNGPITLGAVENWLITRTLYGTNVAAGCITNLEGDPVYALYTTANGWEYVGAIEVDSGDLATSTSAVDGKYYYLTTSSNSNSVTVATMSYLQSKLTNDTTAADVIDIVKEMIGGQAWRFNISFKEDAPFTIKKAATPVESGVATGTLVITRVDGFADDDKTDATGKKTGDKISEVVLELTSGDKKMVIDDTELQVSEAYAAVTAEFAKLSSAQAQIRTNVVTAITTGMNDGLVTNPYLEYTFNYKKTSASTTKEGSVVVNVTIKDTYTLETKTVSKTWSIAKLAN